MIKPLGHSLFLLGLLAALLATWLLYMPGLGGGFLFDDFANLPAIGASGPVDDWPTFWRYLTSGDADPTGRPLALLTFLLDANTWPADPRPFLRSNVILHLLNGALLALLLRSLGRVAYLSPRPPGAAPAPEAILTGGARKRRVRAAKPRHATAFAEGHSQPSTARQLGWGHTWRIDVAAALGAAFWLLHPLWVSTTLYIVQREAMLPATFSLLGLLLWLHGRQRLLAGRTVSALVWIILGLGGCTLLGLLSKANGILLPALALVIEYAWLRPVRVSEGAALDATSLFHGGRRIATKVALADTLNAPEDRQRRAYRWVMLALAWLPTTLVAGYLLFRGWTGLTRGVSAIRPWTLVERLLTEPRILMDYLGLLWLPRPFTPGLFNDHIAVSTSLISPWTTLPSLLAVVGLIIGAWVLRKRVPALAMAALFFFVGQALESSTIALELYFEHRNYLPAMLMFWPLALYLCGLSMRAAPITERSTRTFLVLRGALALVLLSGIGAMTHARAALWGNQHDQALLWAELNPGSPRAQSYAAQAEMAAGHPQRAAVRLRPALARNPEDVSLALNLFGAECQAGSIKASTMAASVKALANTRDPGALLVHWFERGIAQVEHPPCAQLSLDTLEHLLAAAADNPRLMARDGRRQDIAYLQGRIALARDHGALALADFKRALDQQPRASAALAYAAQLGAADFAKQGLALLDHYARIRDKETQAGLDMARVHAWVLDQQDYWLTELARLRQTLRADAAATSRE